MRNVITYGTFDLFHVGHLRLLERAKKLGEQLIVAVSSDEFNEIKGKKTVIPHADRVAIVQALRCVDMVIREDSWAQKAADIERYNVDTFVIGEDWRGKFDHLKTICEVVYLPRTEGVSSSTLKQSMALLAQIARELQ